MKTKTLHTRKLLLPNPILLTLLCTFPFGQSEAQKIIINGSESFVKLKWADFSGKPDKNSAFAAYTSYNSGWKIKSAKVSGDSVQLDGFEFTVEFSNKNSWVKMERATPQLLAHEQGHFNIGVLAGRAIMDTVRKTKFRPSTFKTVLPELISETSKKYRELSVQYDKETDHSKNSEIQDKWNANFAVRLPELYKR